MLGMSIPEEYGGSNLPVFETALVIEEVAKHCYHTAMGVMGMVGVQTRVIATYAPESMKRDILPKVASGEVALAVCMTEPHAGTDVPNYKTNTVIKGDRAVVNGVKTLISKRARPSGSWSSPASTARPAAKASAACWSTATPPASK